VKTAAWICLGLVVGFLLGTIPGRREVTGLKRRIRALERQLAQADEDASGGRLASPLPGLSGMLRGARPPADGADRLVATGPQSLRSDAGRAPVSPTAAAEPPASPPAPSTFGPDGGTQRVRPTREQFDLAVAAQSLRASQTREALREQADLDEAQMAQLDRAVERMNQRLEQYSDALVDLALTEEAPRARDVLSLTRDVTSILADGQGELERLVGDDRLAAIDESPAQIWNYIDLEKFRAAYVANQAD